MSFTSLRARVPHILLITAGTWTSTSQIFSHMKCEKLNMKEPYKGNEHVHTASGSGMRILHVVQAIIPTTSSRQLHLRNVLHVPTVTKNLLFVPRFTYDNNILVEFHPNIFLLRTCIRGPYSLEVGVVVAFMHLTPLMLLSPSKYSVLLKCRLPNGMLG
jgi:hypothetical protein